MQSVKATAFNLLSQLSERRLAAMLGLGFSSGIPFLLVYSTPTAWFDQAGIPIETVGLLSEMTLAYKFKFLWSPFLERFDPPLLGRLLGRRRGWILVSQILIVACLVGVGFGDPKHLLVWTIAFSLALGFAGATQDVTIDGWRINAAPESKAAMASWAEIGWRIGNLAAGGGALLLSDRVGWRNTYLVMAALMIPGMVATLFAPEPEGDKIAAREPRTSLDLSLATNVKHVCYYACALLVVLAIKAGWAAAPLRRLKARLAPDPARPSLVTTIVVPILELVTRLGSMALPILVLVAGFRMPGYISSVMAIPLFKHLHYSNTDIGTVTKGFGFWVAIAATALGGLLVVRIGMMASLVVGTIAGSASHLALAWLASHGDHGGSEFWTFAIAVSIDSFAYALASIILITYMSTLVREDMAASQYALLTSLVALPGSLLAAGSGFVIKRIGFEMFFVSTSLIGLPVAILCLWVWRQHVEVRPLLASR